MRNSKVLQIDDTWNSDRGLLDRISLDQNCLFSVDQKFHFQLINFFETFQFIKTFINDLIKCQKRTYGFWQLIESSNNGILAFKKFLFWQLIKCF
jgi:hypothetical protein